MLSGNEIPQFFSMLWYYSSLIVRLKINKFNINRELKQSFKICDQNLAEKRHFFEGKTLNTNNSVVGDLQKTKLIPNVPIGQVW